MNNPPDRTKFVTQCPGQWRVPNLRKWFVRKGQVHTDATYCLVCVEAGCAGVSKEGCYIVLTNYCNCDCPDPGKHHDPSATQFPTEDQSRLYADYLRTQTELRKVQRDFEILDNKLKTCYPKEIETLFNNPSPPCDPEPLRNAQRYREAFWTKPCGCVFWRNGGEWSTDCGTWYCRWHIWQTY